MGRGRGSGLKSKNILLSSRLFKNKEKKAPPVRYEPTKEFLETKKKVSRAQMAVMFIARNIADMENDASSQNSKAFSFFEELPKHYVGAFHTLVKRQDKSCFWCEEKQNRLYSHVDIMNGMRIDFIRDYAQGGTAKLLRGGGTNCVLVCKDCFTKRYSNDAQRDSLKDWLAYGLAEGFISKEKQVETEKRLLDKSFIRQWQVYVENEQKRITENRLREEQLRKRRALMEAKEFGLPITASTPEINSSIRKKIRKQFFRDQNGSCAWCSETLNHQTISLDHIQTRYHGGSHWYGNMLPSCKRCNNRRGNRTVEDFLNDAKNPNLDLINARLQLTRSDPRTFHAYWIKEGNSYFMHNKKLQEYEFLNISDNF